MERLRDLAATAATAGAPAPVDGAGDDDDA